MSEQDNLNHIDRKLREQGNGRTAEKLVTNNSHMKLTDIHPLKEFDANFFRTSRQLIMTFKTNFVLIPSLK